MTYSRAVVERAGELRRSGLSCREIARELGGPSKSAVARWTRAVAWIGNTYLDDSGRDSPASLNSTGDM